MAFQPVITGTGYSGWVGLKATLARQQAAYGQDRAVQRELDQYRDRIADIRGPEDMVKDYPVLKVALQAHGLSEDLPNRHFIARVLAEGVDAPEDLANRLRDSRYKDLAASYTPAGFALGLPALASSVAKVADGFIRAGFEAAVGEADPDMRLALAFERALPELAADSATNRAGWFRVLGTPNLSSVFRTVFGLPDAFGRLDIDRQLEELTKRAEQRFGTSDLSELSSPDLTKDILQSFFLRKQIEGTGASSPQSVALTLLAQTARAG